MTALRAAPTLRDASRRMLEALEEDHPSEVGHCSICRARVDLRAALAHPPEVAQTEPVEQAELPPGVYLRPDGRLARRNANGTDTLWPDRGEQTKGLLERMIASSEVYADADGVITGYKIKTGALHRLIGLWSVSVPTNLPVAKWAQPEPAGWTLVPIKPTEKMLGAGWVAHYHGTFYDLQQAWGAMLAAAPKIEGEQPPPNAQETKT